MKMLGTIIFIQIVLLTSAFSVFSSNTTSGQGKLFNNANAAYQKQDYQQALALYDSLEKTGFIHPSLYFNIGNTYYKLNNIPKAILYYERAKKYETGNEEIEHNLILANLRIVDKIEDIPQPWINTFFLNFIHRFSSNTWTILNISSIWLSLILLLISFYLKKIKPWARPAALIVMLVFTITLFSARASYLEENKSSSGIIMSQVIELKSAPDPTSATLFILHEGTKAHILESVNDWLKIRLEDGKTGWLQTTSLEKI